MKCEVLDINRCADINTVARSLYHIIARTFSAKADTNLFVSVPPTEAARYKDRVVCYPDTSDPVPPGIVHPKRIKKKPPTAASQLWRAAPEKRP